VEKEREQEGKKKQPKEEVKEETISNPEDLTAIDNLMKTSEKELSKFDEDFEKQF